MNIAFLNRRDFSLRTLAVAGVAATGAASAQGLAGGAKPVAGKDYLVLDARAPVDAQGKVEVVEFFSYNCPHCAAFEPQLEAWAKKLPANVVMRRVPVPFVGNDPDTKQRLFYTLEAMGKLEQYHGAVFTNIHVNKDRMAGDAAVLAWVAKQPGLDAKKFADTFKSFAVVGKAKRAGSLTDAYKVSGVPALGVAGRFYTDGQTAGSMERALQVVGHLIEDARKTA
jgi:protein dithiol oxidoreductase (disulfide-forming)